MKTHATRHPLPTGIVKLAPRYLFKPGLFVLLVSISASTTVVIDSVLLQLKNNYFTGGFLAKYVLESPGQISVYLLAALLLDAFQIVGIWSLIVPVARRIVTQTVRVYFLATVIGLAVPLMFDLVEYRLHQYLGGLVDFGLIWELAGGNPLEMLAQGSGHFGTLIGTIVLLVLGMGIGWRILASFEGYLHRCFGPLALPSNRQLWTAVLVLCIGSSVMLAGLSIMDPSLRYGLVKKPSGAVVANVIGWSTDFDRDGYGLLSRPPDPKPLDASIHPYALDKPGNGIDENAVGGDHPQEFRLDSANNGADSTWHHCPPVLLILLESFRADMLRQRFHGKAITPFMNHLMAEGAGSDQAFSHSGYTISSRVHLFSGKLNPSDDDKTLIDDFKAQGYTVAYFSGQDDSFGDQESTIGTARTDVFYDARQDQSNRYSRFATSGSLAVSWKLLNRRVISFLDQHPSQIPVFLYVNYHDTHFPYAHREMDNILDVSPLPRSKIGPDAAERLHATYANAAANVDRAIEALITRWESKFRGQDPVVLITADHGEALFENGYLGHGYRLSSEQTRVPLIVRGLTGVWPTLMGLADIRPRMIQSLAHPQPGKPLNFEPDSDHSVVQYIGNFGRPRILARRDIHGLLQYDFWNNRFEPPNPSGSVPGRNDQRRFVHLIWTWEALNLKSLLHAGNAG